MPPTGPNPFIGGAPTAMGAGLELQARMAMMGQLQSFSMFGMGAYPGSHSMMSAPQPAMGTAPPTVHAAHATVHPTAPAKPSTALSRRRKEFRSRCICGSTVCRQRLAPFWLGKMHCKELLVADEYAPSFATYFGVWPVARTFIGPWHFMPELRWWVTNAMPDQRFRSEDGGTIMPIMLVALMVREVEMLSALFERDEQYFFAKIRDRAGGVSDDDDVKALQLADLQFQCALKQIDLPPPPPNKWISATDGILGAPAAVDELSVDGDTTISSEGSDGPDVSWEDLAEFKSDISLAVDASSVSVAIRLPFLLLLALTHCDFALHCRRRSTLPSKNY